jgi:hypothetical protein
MLRGLFGWCLWLDRWLHARLGRPYGVVLSIGLMAEILRRLQEAPEALQKPQGVVGTAFVVALNLALLIHQLGEMSERVKTRHGTLVADERPDEAAGGGAHGG